MSAPATSSSSWWQRWRRRRAPSATVGNEVQEPVGNQNQAGNEVRDPGNLVELAALERMIRRSDGFRIAFAVTNHPTLRARLIQAVRRDLPNLTITELKVPDILDKIVTEIEDVARPLDSSRPPPNAVFVVGLDELGSDEIRSGVVAELNFNRDHLWRAASVPVVFWASDLVVREFAQQATDLWSGRSGVYRFHAEDNDYVNTVDDIINRINWGSTPEERREREALLKDLLDESRDDVEARARLLVAFGDAASIQHRYDEAREFYEQALPIYHDIGHRFCEANTLRSLGDTALAQNRYNEAREFHEQALPIYRDIGDQPGEKRTLRSLGDTALAQNRYNEAREFHEQAFLIHRDVGLPEFRISEPVPSASPVTASGLETSGVRVFLSYASKDHSLAAEVHRWLVVYGCEVFLDQDLIDGIAVGEDWQKRLHERLRWADVVVCVITSTYLTSTWCTAEVGIALSRGIRVLPVLAESGVIHPLLVNVQHLDMTRDLGAARVKLAEVLRRVSAAGGWAWPDGRSPFPGLRPFDVTDHRVFFGRSGEVEQLAGLLRSPAERAEQAVLLVVGPSGCGKSSLVRAGLLHVMAEEPGWLTLSPMLPGIDPVDELVRKLTAAARMLELAWTVTDVRHRLGDGDLTGLVAELLLAARAQRLLIVVDQFEELFTQASPGQRARFAQLLHQALGGSVQVIATLRPEFLDQLLVDSGFQVLPTRTYTLRPLYRETLPTVIEGPARLAGIYVDKELVARLVADTDSGEALPLLAFTLAQLADGVGRGGQLSQQRYDQLGGVQGALTRQADAALADAIAATGRHREQVIAGLLRLVTIDQRGRPTPWRVPLDELPEPVTRELDAFVWRRLLTTDTDQGRVVVTVAHEAFLFAWPPLAQAINENAVALRARNALEQAATEWNDNDRSPARLWERGQLATAVTDIGARIQGDDLVTDRVELSPTARVFLRASIRRDRTRRQLALTVLSALLVLAVMATGIAVVQRRAAVNQLDLAVSREVAVQALELRATNPALAAQLGLAAYRLAPTTEARSSLLSTLATPYDTRLTGYTDGVTSVVFSPDGRTLATGSLDDTVRLWDISDSHHPSPLSILTGHTNGVTSVAFSPDGRTLATGSLDQTVRLWAIGDFRHPSTLVTLTGYVNTVTSVAFSRDGRGLATASTDHTARLWNISDPPHPTPLATLTGHIGAVTSVAFSPDGRTLATASTDDTAGLWDLPGPILASHTNAVESVVFSPDGHTLATGSADRTVRLWDVRNPNQPSSLATLTGHTDSVESVAFSPDGRTLATGSLDDTVRLWDISDSHHPSPLSILTGHTNGVTSVAFSPDGHTLATGSSDSTVRLWDIRDPHHPRLLATLTDPVGAAESVAFSPDGRTLATGSLDDTARLWDIREPHQLRSLVTLTGHTNGVTSVAFSPDGHTLATGSLDDTARLWETSVDRVAARVCSITPTITKSEWDQYLPGLTYHPPCP